MRAPCWILLVGALAALACTHATAMRALQGSIEVARLHIDPGPPGRVRALECPSCPRSFRLSEDVEFFVDGERVSAENALRQQGKRGGVIYDLDSGHAARLIW